MNQARWNDPLHDHDDYDGEERHDRGLEPDDDEATTTEGDDDDI
jgi:hypothetical protein